MLTEPIITISGNMAGDPEMRFTPSGLAVASFSVAANPRRFDAGTGEWVNGDPVFMRVTAWRDLAENLCASLRRGDPVLVVGRLRQNSWETRDGEKRRTDEIQADTVAVPLDRRIVRMTKTTREHEAGNGAESGQDDPGSQEAAEQAARPPADRSEPQEAGSGGSSRSRRGGK